MMPNAFRMAFDAQQYPFREIVVKYLGFEPERIHQKYDLPQLRRGTEQHTEAHKKLYSIGPEFHRLYGAFIKGFVQPMLNESIVYQSVPNFRVQAPGNLGVRGFHRDTDDNHLFSEINFWIPLTDVEESNCVWIEDQHGSDSYRPWVMSYGELLVFDGANLSHGNRLSSSIQSRVSFDFRVVPERCFEDSQEKTMYEGRRFALGDYFALLQMPGRE